MIEPASNSTIDDQRADRVNRADPLAQVSREHGPDNIKAAAETDQHQESQLLAGLKAGDPSAFEHFVRSMTPRLLGIVRRYTRNEQDAEDAVQDAFLSAFKALDSFDGRSSLSTWIHRIAINAALMKRRKDRSRRESSIEELLPVFQNGEHAQSPTPWPSGMAGQTSGDSVTHSTGLSIKTRAAVLDALQELPDEYRTVLVLRDVEGLESKAVANSLGISDASVRQRLHRARQALMKLLEPALVEDER